MAGFGDLLNLSGSLKGHAASQGAAGGKCSRGWVVTPWQSLPGAGLCGEVSSAGAAGCQGRASARLQSTAAMGELCQVQAGSAGAGCARWLLSDSTLPAITHDFINHLKKTETSESDQVKLDFLGGSPFPPTFVTDFLAGHSLDIPDCDLQLTHSVSRKSQGNCPICSYYVLTLCRLSHDTYGVSESCSECPRKSLPRGEACAHPLALPSGLVPLTLTALALLPGAAPPVSSQVCVCALSIYIKAVTLEDAGVCQRKQIH